MKPPPRDAAARTSVRSHRRATVVSGHGYGTCDRGAVFIVQPAPAENPIPAAGVDFFPIPNIPSFAIGRRTADDRSGQAGGNQSPVNLFDPARPKPFTRGPHQPAAVTV
jgi:hypothetical protein